MDQFQKSIALGYDDWKYILLFVLQFLNGFFFWWKGLIPRSGYTRNSDTAECFLFP